MKSDRSARALLAPLLLAGLFAFCGPVFAWGPEGHRIIGEVAEKFLLPQARREVARLLLGDRLADDKTLSGRSTLADVANWADEIKDFPYGKARGAWHYDNVPLCGAAAPNAYCPRGRCASAQLENWIRILGDPAASHRRRNLALKWVTHLVGDIHQPLHAADHHDRGGNTVLVSFFGQETWEYGNVSLHSIWDVQMVKRLIAERGGEAALSEKPVGEAEVALWTQGSIQDWLLESHAVARSIVYPGLPAKFACGSRISGRLSIGEGYYAEAAPIVESQLRKAGVRLAQVVNAALGGALK